MNSKKAMIQKREIRTIGADYAPRLREVGEGVESRTIEGYAIVFGRESVLLNDYWDNYREIIEQGAVTQELLDISDIKMTLWHNREKLLARRNEGNGTLEVGIDDKGVWYRFDAPHTPDGDTALELVRRGDLAGSSFIYTTNEADDVRYDKLEDGTIVRHVMSISRIYDMTIASDPAYEDTTVNAREVSKAFEPVEPKQEEKPADTSWKREVAELRRKANNL